MKTLWGTKKRFLFGIVSIVLFLIGSGMDGIYAQEALLNDSSLAAFSVQDLVELRKILARQRERLLKSQEKITQRGVEVTQEFLDKTREENANQDKILIRVAEYYIEDADNEYVKEFERYDTLYAEYEKRLEEYEAGLLKTKPIEPPLPRRNYEKAIAIYDLIIKNFPESDLIDDAYYSKAFLLEKMDEISAARQIYQRIIDEFPESNYAPEAYMKLAESYFYPEPGDSMPQTIVKLNKAIQLYKNVLQYKDSPRYDEALYKLGWSYYRLAGEDPRYYTDAIMYFLAVVRDIEQLKDFDPTGEIIRTDVQPEALQFIAASFVDPNYTHNGVDNARNFLEKLGKPDYGIQIMEHLGDRYAKIVRWNDAIQAYNDLLEMYPEYVYAPRIQKKVADAYIALEDYDKAFEERRELFDNYNPQSAWYQQLEQQEFPNKIAVLDEAYRITEEAFRTNITYLYSIANEAEKNNEPTQEYYTQFVDLCREYLQHYPTDENAYEINWALAYVLDTKLSRFEESFTEYIRVSNDYLETAHQYDAAINAINVADTLVKIAKAVETPTSGVDNVTPKLQVQELLPEEKMLAEAYDNFIKLFPDHPETPTVLAAAGALYYNHRQYDLAKRYYKTMVTKFPKAQQKTIGLVSLMNSYFFLGQYEDAEIVARKILESVEIPPEQVEIAKKRIGESIYKNGEKLEQEGAYLAAAKEYRRVYEQAAEYVNFVDLALFRSARNFEEAGEWLKAIETYEILVNEYPESKHILPALNNIATDYKELEDYINVAKTNERIFRTFPGTPEAENALYNASLFYAKAEAWQEAINANNLYIKTYPNNPESKDLLFENAKYYLKLDDMASANQIYEEFARLYPDDPLAVEAYYNRGVYFYERGQLEEAKAEFRKAIEKSNAFARAGKDPNLYYAAEANYKLGQILYTEYNNIKLTYPQNVLRARLEEKRKKLKEVQEAFTRVIRSGSIRSFEAMYKIAEAYERFADAIANQELPENLTREQVLVEKDRVFRASVPAYDRAMEEYRNVLENLPVLAEKLEISLDTTRKKIEPAPQDTTVLVKKEVEEDSSSRVALKWLNKAKEKISLIQYNIAEKASGFITEYLRVKNPNTGLRALVFQDQVLRRLIAPQVVTTVEAHLKNIQISAELGLENVYVEESKRRVLLARNILAEEYAKLFYDATRYYQNSIPVLEELISKGEGTKTPDGMDYYDYQDSYVMQIIYFMKQFANIALDQYKNTLQIAREKQIENDARLTTEEKLFNFGYEAGELLSNLSQQAAQKAEEMIVLFDSTNNENFQLGSTFFDDQSFELSSYSQNVFEKAYNISKEFELKNIWTQLILSKLVEIDPATYLADLPREKIVIESDSTWKATTVYSAGWNLAQFDDSQWGTAITVQLPEGMSLFRFDSLQISPPAIWATYIPDTSKETGVANPLDIEDRALSDSIVTDTTSDLSPVGGVVDTSQMAMEEKFPEPDTLSAYFRKKVSFKRKPIDGWIAISGEDAYRLYINDVYIIGIDSAGSTHAEMIPWSTIEESIREGENTISVSVTDFNGAPHYGLRLHISLELLPEDVTNVLENIRKQIGTQNIDPEKLKRVMVLNRQRIIE
ncbi:MAG: hypothetical protein D6748_05065 [Calditrichaeota bacterium]|nr:MAG: hypothetical protein D6748_05065 [Calditrichota bacterium]